MSNLNSTKNKELVGAFLSIVAILVILSYMVSYEKDCPASRQTLENLEFSDYVATGLRVVTNPPENISQIVHKSWRKLGTTIIGNRIYESVGQEIRLSIYTFNEGSIPDKEYVFGMQRLGSIQNESYFVGETEILHLNIPTKNSPPMEMDIFQKGKEVYVLRYTQDNEEIAKTVLQLAIGGLEI